MSGYYGNVAVLLPRQAEDSAVAPCLRRAAQQLDEAFIELPEWLEGKDVVPRRIIGVRPTGSQWITCVDPISDEGLENDIALDVAQIYAQAFGAPAVAFSVADGGKLLVMGCGIPRRQIYRWYARGTLDSLTFFEIDPEACHFPREASRLMAPEHRFAMNRLWMETPDGQEEKRMESIAKLFGFCILGNLSSCNVPKGAAVFDLPFRPFVPIG